MSGDPSAAEERDVYLKGLPLLLITDEVYGLAELLMAGVPLPKKASVDSLHISVAAIGGIEYLMTWNCKHIANQSMRPRIEKICRDTGYEPPVICTPQELMEINDENE